MPKSQKRSRLKNKEILDKVAVKEEEKSEQPTSLLSQILKPFSLEFEAVPQHPNFIHSGSLLLDLAVGGIRTPGIPAGRFIEVLAHPAHAKTALAIHIAREIQKAGGSIIYIDRERKFPIEWARKLGLIVDIEPGKETAVGERFALGYIRSIEKTFDFITKTIVSVLEKNKDPILGLFWDSLASSGTESSLSRYAIDPILSGDAPQKIHNGFRGLLNNYIFNKKIWIILLNQTRADMTFTFGKKAKIKGFGGDSVLFYDSVRIFLSEKGIILRTRKGQNVTEGVTIEAKTLKNCIYPPYKAVEFPLYFKTGIDNIGSILDFLIKTKTLKTEGGLESPSEKADGSFEKKPFRIFWPPSSEEATSYSYNEFYDLSAEKFWPEIRDLLIETWRAIHES